jgi:hypothetical protein
VASISATIADIGDSIYSYTSAGRTISAWMLAWALLPLAVQVPLYDMLANAIPDVA